MTGLATILLNACLFFAKTGPEWKISLTSRDYCGMLSGQFFLRYSFVDLNTPLINYSG